MEMVLAKVFHLLTVGLSKRPNQPSRWTCGNVGPPVVHKEEEVEVLSENIFPYP
jgi:hypothetical protein